MKKGLKIVTTPVLSEGGESTGQYLEEAVNETRRDRLSNTACAKYGSLNDLKACSGCRQICYCSRVCQKVRATCSICPGQSLRRWRNRPTGKLTKANARCREDKPLLFRALLLHVKKFVYVGSVSHLTCLISFGQRNIPVIVFRLPCSVDATKPRTHVRTTKASFVPTGGPQPLATSLQPTIMSIPLELVVHILLQLREDGAVYHDRPSKEPPHACSLVCQSWLTFAQQQLFQTLSTLIIITPRIPAQN